MITIINKKNEILYYLIISNTQQYNSIFFFKIQKISETENIQNLIIDGHGYYKGPSEEFQKQIQKKFELTGPERILKNLPNFRTSFLEPAWFALKGLSSISKDDFTSAFQSAKSKAWNFDFYLLILWIFGVLIRYLILLPLRIFFLVCMILISFLAISLSYLIKTNTKKEKLIRFMIKGLCIIFTLSWGSVLRYHDYNLVPKDLTNSVFVANHTSIIDLIIIFRKNLCCIIGQIHGGVLGFFQKNILWPLNPIFFERSTKGSRIETKRRISESLTNSKDPLLIFPEGTCVNNRYCCMFKKGAFELDAKVIPIAIKYNKIFVDAFWNSREESFVKYLLRLMSSWAVVADIYFLEPMIKLPDETAIEFAERVKIRICDRAKLISLPFDGFMKYTSISDVFKKKRAKLIANYLRRKYQLTVEEEKVKENVEILVEESNLNESNDVIIINEDEDIEIQEEEENEENN